MHKLQMYLLIIQSIVTTLNRLFISIKRLIFFQSNGLKM